MTGLPKGRTSLLFNSYVFVYVFLPLALAGYYTTARFGRRPAIVWLIFGSFVFYGWWNPAFVPLLAISIAFNYSASLLIGATESRPTLQGLVTKLAVAANLAALVYYKYAMWLVGLLNNTGLIRAELHGIVLPLGISFFTFTQIGYLLDCRHGIAKDRNLLDYVVFVTFFPHLIAGPILHNGEMMPQFADPKTYRFAAAEFSVGLGIFVMGMLKKCLIADPIGANVPAGVRSSRSTVDAGVVAGGAVVLVAVVFRLLRLFRHGDRTGADVQPALSAEFQLALQGAERDRILAALAHDPDAVFHPVCL